jgi:hypothetical protein
MCVLDGEGTALKMNEDIVDLRLSKKTFGQTLFCVGKRA